MPRVSKLLVKKSKHQPVRYPILDPKALTCRSSCYRKSFGYKGEQLGPSRFIRPPRKQSPAPLPSKVHTKILIFLLTHLLL